jgi:tetratricopeptide (TPR) repeat protein
MIGCLRSRGRGCLGPDTKEAAMPNRKKIIIAVAVLFLSLGGLPLIGQQGRGKGRIKGTVTDADTGNPLPGVLVSALSNDYGTKFESKTGNKGTWSIGGLGSGNFKVTYSLSGYIEISQTIFVSQFAANNDPLIAKLEPVKTSAAETNDIADAAARAIFDEGLQLFEAKEYSRALKKFQEFLELKPEYYQALMNIGNCYKEMGDYESAVETYQRVLNRIMEEGDTPTAKNARAGAYVGLSEIYLKKGDLEKAEQVLEEAIEQNPADENLAFKFGEIYFTQGETAKAAAFYKKAIAANANWAPPYRQLGYAYLNMGEYALALEMMRKFLDLAPDDARAGAVRNLIPQIEKMVK